VLGQPSGSNPNVTDPNSFSKVLPQLGLCGA
jgi:hypothetical protein